MPCCILYSYKLRQSKMKYSDYLQSSHWQEYKKTYRKWHPYECSCCKTTEERLELHHLTYRNIGKEKFKDTIYLCPFCHQSLHRFKNKKLCLEQLFILIKTQPFPSKKKKKKKKNGKKKIEVDVSLHIILKNKKLDALQSSIWNS